MGLDIDRYEKLLASRLRVERERAKLSQLDLANKAELSQNLVYFIESGRRVPTLHTILKLCDALDISPVSLFQEPEEERQNAKDTITALLNQFM